MKADLKAGQRVRCPHCKKVLEVDPPIVDEKPPVEQVCQNCRFYQQLFAGRYAEGTYKFGLKKGKKWVRSTASEGKCKAEAPNPVQRFYGDAAKDIVSYNNRFPDTRGNDWCGKFQAR